MKSARPLGKTPRRGRLRIATKRVYDPPLREDGYRILIDRLWPRGLTKEKAKVDLWLKEIAPSHGLRKWFGHEPEKWPAFKKKYFAELKKHRERVETIVEKGRTGPVTILFGAKETHYNNALALKEFIETELSGKL